MIYAICYKDRIIATHSTMNDAKDKIKKLSQWFSNLEIIEMVTIDHQNDLSKLSLASSL